MSTISRTPCDIPLWSELDFAPHPLNVRFTPKKRTLGLGREMSALCQKWTLPMARRLTMPLMSALFAIAQN